MASKRKKRPDPVQVIEPTPEQLAKGEFGRQVNTEKNAAPYRRVPVIQSLYDKGKLTERAYKALGHYRDVKELTDTSEVTDSVGGMMSKVGGGAPGSTIPMKLKDMRINGTDWDGPVSYLERELGSLADIAFAVAVRDVTLSQWAMRGRSKERREERKGKAVVWLEPYRSDYLRALAEIRMAGLRLAAALCG